MPPLTAALRTSLTALLALVMLAGCATRPPESDPVAVAEFERANDPFEPLNRVVFDFNTAADKLILSPIATGYRAVTPKPVRSGFTNFFNNLEEPWTFINELLQGKVDRAGRTLTRFLVNSTVGLAGFFEVAAQSPDLPRNEEDFGQTLAVWGVGEGPYVMLPFFGPSNFRDGVGLGAQIAGDPVGLASDRANVEGLRLGLAVGQVIDVRARETTRQAIDQLYSAEDPYLLARSAYRQNRNFNIADGKVQQTQEEADIFDEDFGDDFDDLPAGEDDDAPNQQ